MRPDFNRYASPLSSPAPLSPQNRPWLTGQPDGCSAKPEAAGAPQPPARRRCYFFARGVLSATRDFCWFAGVIAALLDGDEDAAGFAGAAAAGHGPGKISDSRRWPTQLTPIDEGYIDFFGRPWAQNWEEHFEQGWQKPGN